MPKQKNRINDHHVGWTWMTQKPTCARLITIYAIYKSREQYSKTHFVELHKLISPEASFLQCQRTARGKSLNVWFAAWLINS
jgi:hypothetical protein